MKVHPERFFDKDGNKLVFFGPKKPPRKYLTKMYKKAVQKGKRIIIDCSFDDQMTD